ncbi:MAG: hypothetical protein V4710_22355, partial [Verrucomicrobiota bacterium]
IRVPAAIATTATTTTGTTGVTITAHTLIPVTIMDLATGTSADLSGVVTATGVRDVSCRGRKAGWDDV